MGQGGSKQRETQPPIQSGVHISNEFAAKLSGNPSQQISSASSSGGGEMQAMRPAPLDRADRDAEAMIRRNESIQRALERSQRVGNLLLTREEEELARIDDLAEEMIQREYSTPSRERPCQGEASACLQCYETHADDPTACADVVDVYSKCARQAAASVLRS